MLITAAVRLSLLVLVLSTFLASAVPPARAAGPAVHTDEQGRVIGVETNSQRCDPPCAEGQVCQQVCRDGECDAKSTARNPCRHCEWECVD